MSQTDSSMSVQIPLTPDYTEFVDADIRALFENRGAYFSHEPLMAQLIKEFRLLRVALTSKTDGDALAVMERL